MKNSLIALVATGVVAAAAGVAVAGLPSDPPGGDLRISQPASTSTSTSLPPVTTIAPTTTVVPAAASPSTSTVTTTAPAADPDAAPDAAPDAGTDSTVAPDDGAQGETTTTSLPVEPIVDDLVERGDLVVVTLNAGSRAGIAGDAADLLRPFGYADVSPLDALESSELSNVYHREGLEAEAVRLAEDLGWSKGDIAPLDTAPAFDSSLDVDLAVVFGIDSR